MDKQIGLIGLGTMGMPMAKNILSVFKHLMASDIVSEKQSEIKNAGAVVAVDNIHIAHECEVIYVSLLMPDIVEKVLTGSDGLLENGRPGQVIFDTSTISYGQSTRISEMARAKGIIYIDAPISGGAACAEKGTLSIMVGASKEELQRDNLIQYLEAIGDKLHFSGKRGGGVGLKILNNMLSKAILFADAEAILMAEHMGIPFAALYDVISASSSRNGILDLKKEHIEYHDYAPSSKSYFPVTGTLKDLALARQLGDDLGVSSFNCNTVIQWYRMAMQRGYGQWDSSSIVELMRELEPAPAQWKGKDYI